MSTLKFRILLDSVDEEVFRDILIDENENFETLHQAIIKAFSFSGQQLASFYMSNEEWDKGEEIGLMDMNFNDGGAAIAMMANTSIKSKITSSNQKIILVYDFLKMWIFLIELQEVLPKKITHPETILIIGTAPNENDKSEDFSIETDDLGEGLESNFDEFSDFDDEDFSEGFEKYDDY